MANAQVKKRGGDPDGPVSRPKDASQHPQQRLLDQEVDGTSSRSARSRHRQSRAIRIDGCGPAAHLNQDGGADEAQARRAEAQQAARTRA